MTICMKIENDGQSKQAGKRKTSRVEREEQGINDWEEEGRIKVEDGEKDKEKQTNRFKLHRDIL